MSSNIKRNKRLVDLLIRGIKNNLDGYRHLISQDTLSFGLIYLYLYGLKTPFELILPSFNSSLIVFEEKNIIYIGFDLTKLVIGTKTLDDYVDSNDTMETSFDIFQYALSNLGKSNTAAMQAILFKDLYKEVYQDCNDIYNGGSLSKSFYSSNFYKMYSRLYTEVASSNNAFSFKLKDTEFKMVKSRRDVYPLVWIDVSKGYLYFRNKSWVTSSSKGICDWKIEDVHSSKYGIRDSSYRLLCSAIDRDFIDTVLNSNFGGKVTKF